MSEKFDLEQFPENVKQIITATGSKLTGSREMLRRAAEREMMKKLAGEQTTNPATVKFLRDSLNRSDWDFALADTPENRMLLQQLNGQFFEYSKSYGDSLSTCVFKTHITKQVLNPSDYLFERKAYKTERVEIDFILKRDMDLFDSVWDEMDIDYYASFIWKRSPMYKDMSHSDTKTAIAMIMNTLYYGKNNGFDGSATRKIRDESMDADWVFA